MKLISRMAFLSWQWGLTIVYFGFVILTIIFPHFPDSRLKWHVLFNFTLSAEMNLAVWVSGISLLLLALLSYELFSDEATENRKAWLVLAAVFFGLYLDEIGSLHERIINDWRVLIPYVAIGFVLLSYALGPMFFKKEARKTAVFILIGFGLFGLVAGQEIIEHAVTWPDWAMGIRVGLEEGTELAGIFLCLQAIIWQRQRINPGKDFRAIITDPSRFKYLSGLLTGGLLLHFLSLSALLTFNDIGLRGNPAVVYPAASFLILATAVLWQYHRDTPQKPWLPLSIYLVICSVGTLYMSNLLLDTVVWVPGAALLILPAGLLWRYWLPMAERRKYVLFVAALFLLLTVVTAYHSTLNFNRVEFFLLLANIYFLSQLVLFTSFYMTIHDGLPMKHLLGLSCLALLWLAGYAADLVVIQFLALGLWGYFATHMVLQSPDGQSRPYPVNLVA